MKTIINDELTQERCERWVQLVLSELNATGHPVSLKSTVVHTILGELTRCGVMKKCLPRCWVVCPSCRALARLRLKAT